jgi:glycosyltransferase involved in cell wall biosynthesis
MTNIMLIMPSFRGGGAERVFIDLAIGLHQTSFNVELVVLSDEGPYKEVVPTDLKVTILGTRGVKQSFKPLIESFKNKNPDVVISCLTHLNIIVAIAKMLSGRDIKLILTEHNHYTSEKLQMSFLSRVVLKTLTQLTYKLADKIVAVSQGIKEDLENNLGIKSSKIGVIYNPIDIGRIQKLGLEEYSLNKSSPVFVGMGRLVPQKRFDRLIKAFSIVKKEISTASLIIIGSGPEENILQKQIDELNLNESVKLQPFTNNPFKIINKCDIFVLSSDFEGFGNVIVEALALGKKVVATNCPSGPNEILEDGKFGHLVSMDSGNRLAEKMISSVSDNTLSPEDLKKRSLVFDKQVAVDSYKLLIEKLV